jgi:uncharacterized membrane protein
MNPHIVLSLFHIFLVVPLFLVVGFLRANTPDWLYWVLLVLGLIIGVYHIYKLFIRYMHKTGGQWINLIHILFVAPVLVYVGYNKKESLRAAYELLLLGGFSALGYHVLSIVRSLETLDNK